MRLSVVGWNSNWTMTAGTGTVQLQLGLPLTWKNVSNMLVYGFVGAATQNLYI